MGAQVKQDVSTAVLPPDPERTARIVERFQSKPAQDRSQPQREAHRSLGARASGSDLSVRARAWEQVRELHAKGFASADLSFSSYNETSSARPASRRVPEPDTFRRGVAWALYQLGDELGWDGAKPRAERWMLCGRAALEIKRECEHQSDGQLFMPYRCHLRICPSCARRRSRAVAVTYAAVLRRSVARLAEGIRSGEGWRPRALPSGVPPGRNFRLVTLTRHNPGGLDPAGSRRRVRETRGLAVELWRETWGSHSAERVKTADAGVGAIYSLEVAGKSSRGRGGMVHVHMLVYGHYWPQADLSARWKRLTGDSHVVDIRKVRISHRKLARLKAEGIRPTQDHVLRAGVLECLKYATKPPADTDSEAFQALAAIEYALEGTRRLGTLGIFYGKVSDTLDDPDYAPESEGLTCPRCGAPAQAGGIVGPGYLAHVFKRGHAAWHPDMVAQPPPSSS